MCLHAVSQPWMATRKLAGDQVFCLPPPSEYFDGETCAPPEVVVMRVICGEILTVIFAASVYGEKQLGFDTSTLIATILFVQFVAFGGALLFGKIAERHGSRRVILAGLGVWMLVVTAGYFLPARQLMPFLLMATAIGLVLGGTQALSRSFFSLLIPRGREAEYFSLYQACERGTSWLGTLVFGVVHQATDSYRPAIFALIVFFAVGAALLFRVDARRGIRDAGNAAPAAV